MSQDQIQDVISALKSGKLPAPSITEIRKAYLAIHAISGVHSEPLRTHLFGDGWLVVGPMLGAKLHAYSLEALPPAVQLEKVRF